MGDGHTLIVIGYMGIKRAYLDIPMAEAIARWMKTEEWAGPAPEFGPGMLREFSFIDEFQTYDAWADTTGCPNCKRYQTAKPRETYVTCSKCGRKVVDAGQFAFYRDR